MIVQAENARLAVVPAVGLEALEACARIMQHVGCGMELQWCNGLDGRGLPGAIAILGDDEVVAENGTERGH